MQSMKGSPIVTILAMLPCLGPKVKYSDSQHSVFPTLFLPIFDIVLFPCSSYLFFPESSCNSQFLIVFLPQALEEEVLKVIPSSKSRFWKTFSSSSASLHSTGKCQLDLTSCNQSHHQ
ncbi:uncharacterized protein LOC116419699 isoform X1 [Sarcophilus harrisii]|uniref:uncharacterized protein LOC116419699 isoform X1 n=1 Tax=Sarcophilus harrisii TaxID=9305 RepID=UPI001302025E|nr:uncharacterized protein LOC116419699 isoform X1 [Sarcophilus harrisii]